MDPKPTAPFTNVAPKLSRHSHRSSNSQSRSSLHSPRSSGSSPDLNSGAGSKTASQRGDATPGRKRPLRGTRHWRHVHRPHSPAASPSLTKSPLAASLSSTSAPAVVQTPPFPKKDERAGKSTPGRSGLSSAAHTMSSLLRKQQAATPRIVPVLAVSAVLACTLAVYFLYRTTLSGASKSQASLASHVCVAAECEEHASFFRRNLYTRADPCVDLDAHVCSHWAPSSALASHLTRDMALAWTLRVTDSLVADNVSDDASYSQGTWVTERKVISAFLRKCVAQKDDNPDSLRSVREFASELGIPWPYVVNDSAVQRTNPFEVLIRLDVLLGLQLWCQELMRGSTASIRPLRKLRWKFSSPKKACSYFVQTAVLKQLREKPIPPMLVISRTDTASVWLDLVDALDRNQGRVAYYQNINSLYGVPLPNASTMTRHLKMERDVLTALATVVNETNREAVDTTLDRIELAFTHLGDIPLAKFMLSFFNASGIHERSRVYIDSRRFVVAVDELLGKYGRGPLMEHIAWWFTQLCAVMASNKARMLITGNEAGSRTVKKTWCFYLASAWFGPTLYSIISHFTPAEERRTVDDFERSLLGHVNRAVKNMSWTDETTRRAMIRRLNEMRVDNWQGDANATSSLLREETEALTPEDWSNTTEEFLDILIAKMSERLSKHAQSRRPYEGKRWLQKPYDGLRYAYLSNTLVVMQATTASPLFYPSYARGGVLSAASFGGLATAFLETALRMFDRQGIRIDEGQARAWMSARAERQLFRRLRGSSGIGENMLQAGSLQVAWQAYKSASPSDSPLGGALDIADSHGKTQRYTADQLFFLTYCRRFCNKQTSCNSAARSLADFGSVFGCAKRRPEEDDLSQYRFFA
ncbi:endothelin-converting enzyme-like 1 [Rhipicephalus sanguineus]|uniref:endothelin-converting enzyme-like 1 n=1 Tax=Rhipicephalus sanguineus TaxID=34632 RepID=UPI001893FBA4|nr:endothelin-converting enzyme-like 1 [Rhipicephalus sanguineus]